jgi:CheY-like chemotaxis protein
MARQQPTRTSNVTIDEVIAAAVEVVGYSVRSSDIELAIELEPDLPPIWADPDQLSQVLINLIVNAEQALHGWDGPRKISVATRLHANSGSVVVEVSDSGPGIPRHILPRIFEPFFTTKGVGEGTGIGLSFCHRVVQSHGGTIQVEATEGRGSKFVVSLPASHCLEQSAGPVEEIEATARFDNLACLVVEDEMEVRELIADVLRRDGFQVVVAGSGEEALRQINSRNFALILSDLKMPNMDGRHLFNHISDRHPAKIERLAFLTGDTISPDAQVFLRATKRPYLEKPVKPTDLRAFVSKLVNKAA